MFNHEFFIERKIDKSQIKRFVSCLSDIWKGKFSCKDEEKIFIKKKLLLILEDKFDLTNDDYDYIDGLLSFGFKESNNKTEETCVIGQQMSLI